MKRIMSLILLVSMFLSSCGYPQNGTEPTIMSTIEAIESVEYTEPQQSVTLGITLDELINVLKPVQELHTIATYETDNFTISKEGSEFWGTVCFAKPGNNELSTVLFLSPADAWSESMPRKAATGSQKVIADYCEKKGISVIVSEYQNSSTSVLSVNATDSGFDIESLPLSVRQFRSDSEFLADNDRRDTCSKLLNECRYTELYDYILEFLNNYEISKNDIIEDLQNNAQKLSELSADCEIITDNVDKETTVRYAKLKEIDSINNVVPILSTSAFGISIEYKLGFKRSDWLFFDKITVTSNNLEPKTITCNISDTNRDVLSGSLIQESTYSYIDIASYIEDEGAVIRFSNTDTRESLDHELTEMEIVAISKLEKIRELHSDIFYGIKSWEDM